MSVTHEREFLSAVLLGEPSAVALCELLGRISQRLDDLYDQGCDRGSRAVLELAWEGFAALPENSFYQQHFTRLQPLITRATLDWLTANELEQGDDHDRTLAFVLRDSLVGVIVEAARIIGGDRHALSRAARIQRFFHDEPLPQYLSGLPREGLCL